MKLFQTYLHKMTSFMNCKGQLISKANCQAKRTNELGLAFENMSYIKSPIFPPDKYR